MTVPEAVFALAAGSLLVGSLVELADRAARRTLLQAEARVVSAAADGALKAAERDIRNAISTAALSGGAVLLGRAGLLAAGDLAQGFPRATPSGRGLSFAHYAVTADTVLAAAWAEGGPIAGGTSLPATGIRLTGRLGGADAACPAGFICGPGLRRDVMAMLTALGGSAPAAGSMIAIRSASLLAVNDALLRTDAVAARPELTRMDADLEITGTVVNAAAVDAPGAALRLPAGGRAHVAGLLEAGVRLQGGRVELRGDLTVGGDLTVTGAVNGIGVVRTNGGTLGVIEGPDARLDVLGTAAFGSMIQVGMPAARSGGAVAQESGLLDAGDLTASEVQAPRLDAGNVEVAAAGSVTGRRAVLGELRSHAASGRNLVSGRFRAEGIIHVDSCPNCGSPP